MTVKAGLFPNNIYTYKFEFLYIYKFLYFFGPNCASYIFGLSMQS